MPKKHREPASETNLQHNSLLFTTCSTHSGGGGGGEGGGHAIVVCASSEQFSLNCNPPKIQTNKWNTQEPHKAWVALQKQ